LSGTEFRLKLVSTLYYFMVETIILRLSFCLLTEISNYSFKTGLKVVLLAMCSTLKELTLTIM